MTKKTTPGGAPTPDAPTVAAIRAVVRGVASEAQQKRAMRYLLSDLAGVTAIEPAGLSSEDRHFIAGRRFVGMTFASIGGASLLGFDPPPAAD